MYFTLVIIRIELKYHTSKTLSNISTVKGNSSLIATVALKVFLDSLHRCSRPKQGGSPGEESMYVCHDISGSAGGFKEFFLVDSEPKINIVVVVSAS
jgi:hypothetical protein